MKKLVECQYKNGSLVFGTVEGYTEVKASQIKEIFTKQKLLTEIKPMGNKLFTIVGRLNVHYDPFVTGEVKWDEVVTKMVVTKNILQQKLETLIAKEQGGGMVRKYMFSKMK